MEAASKETFIRHFVLTDTEVRREQVESLVRRVGQTFPNIYMLIEIIQKVKGKTCHVKTLSTLQS